MVAARTLLCLALLLLPSPLRAAAGPAKETDLDRRLRLLEKEIEKVRGLAFKAPVTARVLPRPARAARGLQGYYSPKDKALVVYDDVKSNYERGVLIHEMVHALQDQHFGL